MKKILQRIIWAFFCFPMTVYAQYDQYGATTTSGLVNFVAIINVFKWFLGLFALHTFLIVFIACILFITSGGDEDRMDTSIRWWKTSTVVFAIIAILYVGADVAGDMFGKWII